ncbi:hypothetical protein F4781DRAFT_441378 [Annulohypoxylon bovei var. microspora]|nr:hypothetical protein F4781DRAFT_441378 [Annulohypoxylon bovei var. microspora]
MASRQELDRRLDCCNKLVKRLLDTNNNDDEFRESTQFLQNLINKEKSTSDDAYALEARMDQELDRYRRGFKSIVDDQNKIDPKRLSRKAKKLEQSRFDNLATLILGRDGHLDYLRDMSPEHRNALLNGEKVMLQMRIKELETENNDLQSQLDDKDVELHMKSGHLRTRQTLSDTLRRRAESRKNKLKTANTFRKYYQKELAKAQATIQTQTQDISNKDSVILTLESLVGSLLSQSATVIHRDLCSWASFAQVVREAVWVPVCVSKPPWTFLQPWELSDFNDGPNDDVGAEIGLIGVLARLYGISTPGRSGQLCQPLRLLTQKLGSVDKLPLGVIVAVFNQLIGNIEGGFVEQNHALQYSALAILQAARSIQRRLSIPNVAVAAIEARAEALVFRSVTAITQLADILKDDGITFINDLIMKHGSLEDPIGTGLSSNAIYSPGTNIILIRLPDSGNRVWSFSLVDKTIRAIDCRLGRWKGSSTRYSIAAPDKSGDIIIECRGLRDKCWLHKNMLPDLA